MLGLAIGTLGGIAPLPDISFPLGPGQQITLAGITLPILGPGGGVSGWKVVGATDDFSVRAANEEVPLRDVHATVLRLMGLDQYRLSILHAGRNKRLTDIGGRVIEEILI